MRLPLLPLAMVVVVTGSACLPISWSMVTSPRIVGTFRSPEGTPLGLQSIAVATDSSCAAPKEATFTDSAGSFTLPRTREEFEFILLLPWDAGRPRYTLCTIVASHWTPVARGYARHGNQVDAITCVRLSPDHRRPPACRLASRE